VYGEAVGRTCIAELAASVAPARPASAPAESEARPIPLGTVRMAAASSARTPAPAVAPAVGTLSQPVSSTVTPVAPSRRPLAFIAAAGAAILALAVATVAIYNGRGAAQATSNAATGLVVPATQATQVTHTTAEPAPSHAMETNAPVQTQTATPTPPVVTTSAPRPKASAHATASASAAPLKTTPATTTNCDPPYVIDSAGKHYKPECLK
jgi:hypothetical protein